MQISSKNYLEDTFNFFGEIKNLNVQNISNCDNQINSSRTITISQITVILIEFRLISGSKYKCIFCKNGKIL